MQAQSSIPTAEINRVRIPPAWQTDPSRYGPFGIACGGRLFVALSRDPRQSGGLIDVSAYPAGKSLPEMVEAARRFKLPALWVVPDRGLDGDPNWPASLAGMLETPDWDGHMLTARSGVAADAGQPAGAILRDRDGRTIRVHLPAVQDHWRINTMLDALPPDPQVRARVVASALVLGMFTLGTQFRFSPSHAGISLLRRHLRHWQDRHGLDLTLAPQTAAWIAEIRAHPIEWARDRRTLPPYAEPQPVWHYDRNLSYVASAGEVGTGAPRLAGNFVPGKPGVYRIVATAPADWPAGLIGPFQTEPGRYPPAVMGTFAWEPQIRCALAWGWKVRVITGWVWDQKHDLFRTWRERIRDARMDLAASADAYADMGNPFGAVASAIAEQIVKHVGRATIGRLVQREGKEVVPVDALTRDDADVFFLTDGRGKPTGFAERKAPVGRSDLIRPDWWSTVIANANERLLNAVYTLAPDSCVGCYVDAFYSTKEIPGFDAGPLAFGKFKLDGRSDVPAESLADADAITLPRIVKAYR